MNRPSLERFAKDVKPGGVVIYDTTIGEFSFSAGIKAVSIPAVQTAREAGNEKAANNVILGVLKALGSAGLPGEVFAKAIEETFAKKPKLIAPNLKALDAGYTIYNKMYGRMDKEQN